VNQPVGGQVCEKGIAVISSQKRIQDSGVRILRTEVRRRKKEEYKSKIMSS